jgi:hypothetical protein
MSASKGDGSTTPAWLSADTQCQRLPRLPISGDSCPAEEAKDAYLLTNPTIRNAKAIVRSATRQR